MQVSHDGFVLPSLILNKQNHDGDRFGLLVIDIPGSVESW